MNNFVPNFWTLVVQDNKNLLSEKNQTFVDIFRASPIEPVNPFINHFQMDGWSGDAHISIANDLMANKEMFKVNPLLQRNKPSLFYFNAEGFCTPDFFKSIHDIIDLNQLTGPCYFLNAAVNVQYCYDKFCEREGIQPRLKKCFYRNTTWTRVNHDHYSMPTVPIDELPLSEQKLFCCFNWNSWDHRVALLYFLNYYDLIDDGYITSPTGKKFKYDLDNDITMFLHKAYWFKHLPEYEDIMSKSKYLIERLPLIIDDRSKFSNTDEAASDGILKAPLHRARVNSLIEVVAETRFIDEHFFSEKTYWPVKIGKPFLLVSAVNALKSFKAIGFETFNILIDESYDNIIDDAKRTLEIVRELSRLKEYFTKDKAGFLNDLQKLKPVLEHNKQTFLEKRTKYDKFDLHL